MTRKVLSEWGAYNSTTGQYELDLSKANLELPKGQALTIDNWLTKHKNSSGVAEEWAQNYVDSFAVDITEEEAAKRMQQAEVAN
jgi:hypothetical protein